MRLRKRPGTVYELRARFVRDCYEPDQIPSGEQATMLIKLLDLYDAKGLFPQDRPASLCDVCPNRDPCWTDDPGARRAGPGEDGSVCLPWIGPRYPDDRVAILAINPNIGHEDETDLLIEHGITWTQHISGLTDGYRSYKGSRFAFGAMRSAAALLDVVDGNTPRDREPADLVDAVFRVARLQAVKCVPKRDGSSPLPQMWDHCPTLLLDAELELLRPRHLLVLGENPYWAVKQLDGFRPRPTRDSRLRRGRLERVDWSAYVYGVHHPRRGDASERALLRSLTATARSNRRTV